MNVSRKIIYYTKRIKHQDFYNSFPPSFLSSYLTKHLCIIAVKRHFHPDGNIQSTGPVS